MRFVSGPARRRGRSSLALGSLGVCQVNERQDDSALLIRQLVDPHDPRNFAPSLDRAESTGSNPVRVPVLDFVLNHGKAGPFFLLEEKTGLAYQSISRSASGLRLPNLCVSISLWTRLGALFPNGTIQFATKIARR